MEVLYESAFLRDLKRIRSKSTRRRILEAIEKVKEAPTIQDIPNMVKLRGYEAYFRIRVGEYRLGVEMVDETVIFVCCLHRKDVYRYFPPG